MSFTKDEVFERRVGDFEKVDNFLRDLDCSDISGVPHKEIRKVIEFMYDLFGMPEDGFDARVLAELKRKYKWKE